MAMAWLWCGHGRAMARPWPVDHGPLIHIDLLIMARCIIVDRRASEEQELMGAHGRCTRQEFTPESNIFDSTGDGKDDDSPNGFWLYGSILDQDIIMSWSHMDPYNGGL